MWWDWLIVGVLITAATIYLSRQAVAAVRRLRGGGACSSGGCGTAEPSPGKAKVRELVSLNLPAGMSNEDEPGRAVRNAGQ